MNEICYFCPNEQGYEQFRAGVHRNCVTGFLHFLFMPLATVGAFMMCLALAFYATRKRHSAYKFTRNLLVITIGFFAVGYATFTRLLELSILCVYWYLARKTLHQINGMWKCATKQSRKTDLDNHIGSGADNHIGSDADNRIGSDLDNHIANIVLIYGIMALLFSVCVMEFIGHWFIEDHASDVWQLGNSVFHTPLYGLRSLWYPFTGECVW